MCGDGSTDRVVFRGTLIATDGAQSDQIRQHLQEWVKTEPTILVQGVQLKIAPCVVKLTESQVPKCVPLNQPPTAGVEASAGKAESGSIGFPVYVGIAGGALLLLICVTTILIIVIVVMKKRQKKLMQRPSVRRSECMYSCIDGIFIKCREVYG